MKCNQSGPEFELVSPCPYPATITITPRAPGIDGDSNCTLGKKKGIAGDQKNYRDHSNCRMVKIGQNNNKSLRELIRFAVNENPLANAAVKNSPRV